MMVRPQRICPGVVSGGVRRCGQRGGVVNVGGVVSGGMHM